MDDLKGICAALPTPMSEDGAQVNYDAFKRQIDILIDAGIDILCSSPGTGEFTVLTVEERRKLAHVASKQIAGRAKFIVHTSALRTEDVIEHSLHAESVGADAVMILPPFFEGPGPDGVYSHYETISRKIKTPIMAYNIPMHSHFDITPEFFKRLTEIDLIQYIKDTTGDFSRMQQLISQGVKVFNGVDPFSFGAMTVGAAGCFWGSVNAMPKESVHLKRLIEQGNLHEAAALWKRMLPLTLFCWNNPFNPSVKAATKLRINDLGPCRPPAELLKPNEMDELKLAMELLEPTV